MLVESKLVKDIQFTKEMLSKAHQDLEIKTNALNAELEKVKISDTNKFRNNDVSIVKKINVALQKNVKQHPQNIFLQKKCRS